MRYSVPVAALLASASAFPAVQAPESVHGYSNFEELTALRKRDLDTRDISESQDNCGFFPCDRPFDPKGQFVSVSKADGHEWRAPKKTEVRGPCPGLNAAANHAYIDRTGVIDFHDTTEGLHQALGMGKDWSGFLFFFSLFNSGSPIDLKWSIGGPFSSTTFGGLLGGGNGISNSHNKYDGDASPGRGDAYLHNGDSHSLNLPNFMNLYKKANSKGQFTLDILREQVVDAHDFTKQHNPYGFFGPTFAVPPIAHQFIVNFMSNHSASKPGGTLTKDVLKTFFSVKEKKDGSLVWVPGYDRLPNNWYRRPDYNPYSIQTSVGDFAITCSKYPQICEIGGNLGKPGQFAGVNIEDVSGGLFTSADLLKGNNLGCFIFQSMTAGIPDIAEPLLSGITKASRSFQKLVGGQTSKLGCPELTQYNVKKFKRFPGFTWEQPLQPATPY